MSFEDGLSDKVCYIKEEALVGENYEQEQSDSGPSSRAQSIQAGPKPLGELESEGGKEPRFKLPAHRGLLHPAGEVLPNAPAAENAELDPPERSFQGRDPRVPIVRV